MSGQFVYNVYTVVYTFVLLLLLLLPLRSWESTRKILANMSEVEMYPIYRGWLQENIYLEGFGKIQDIP